jgi:hypothetical protein
MPAETEDVIHAETDGNTDTITLKAVEHGESWIVVDRAEYEAAKRTQTVDLLLDAHLSDIDSSTVVYEPDGTKVDPYTGTITTPDSRRAAGFVGATPATDGYSSSKLTIAEPGDYRVNVYVAEDGRAHTELVTEEYNRTHQGPYA